VRAALAIGLTIWLGLAQVALSRANAQAEGGEGPEDLQGAVTASEEAEAPPPVVTAEVEDEVPPPVVTAEVAAPAPAATPPPVQEQAPIEEPAEEEQAPSILETSPLLVSMAFFTGPAQAGDLDAALSNFGYSPSDWFWGFDVSVEARVVGPLFIGARGDFRMRQWGFWGGSSADAFGPSLLAVLDVRLPLNDVLDLGGVVGGGFGAAIVRVRENSDVAGLPRLHAGLQFGVTLVSGLRAHIGAAFDYAESLSLNDYGYGVSFSIAAFRFGFEGRL